MGGISRGSGFGWGGGGGGEQAPAGAGQPLHHSSKRITMSNELQVRNIWQIQPNSEENAPKAQSVCNKNKLPSTQLIMELALTGGGFSSFFGFAAHTKGTTERLDFMILDIFSNLTDFSRLEFTSDFIPFFFFPFEWTQRRAAASCRAPDTQT